MPTPNRGYIYPATSSPATVPADLQGPLEQIDADVQTLADVTGQLADVTGRLEASVGGIVSLNPDGTAPDALEAQIESIAKENGLPAGDIPVFSTLAEAQAWELANPGRSALTTETPPDPAAWPASAPVFSIAAGSYTIPVDAGATYTVEGVTKAAGTHSVVAPVTVTVEAVAKPGYTLAGVTEWTQAFPLILGPYDAEAVKSPIYLRLDEVSPIDRDSLVNRGTADTIEWFNAGKGVTVANFGAPSVGVAPASVYGTVGAQNFTFAGGPFTLAAAFADVTGTSTSTGAHMAGVSFMTHVTNGSVFVSGFGTTSSGLKPMPARLHATVTWADGVGRVYVDGDLVIERTVAHPAASGYMTLPRVSEDGRMGGLVFDNTRAWTDAEIKALSDGVERV